MNTVAAANQEEAAATAAEFLSSLDNLPNEVQFLLSEIKHKETRAQEITLEVQKETTRYVRHTLKSTNNAKDSTKENGKDTREKDALIPARVSALHEELHVLCTEKMTLASRLVNLLTRVRARLDHDLAKVLQLSGEQPTEHYEVRGGYVVGVTPVAPGLSASLSTPGAAGGISRNVVDKVTENIRAALAADPNIASVVSVPSPSPSGPPPQKRRRVAAPSTPTSVSRAHTPQARSRLAQQVHLSPPRGRRAPSTVGDEDAEGEDDADAEGDKDDQETSGDPEDEELYCFCQEKSYGEMIGCDNDGCKYQWFHLSCVGLNKPLPESWFCSECVRTLNLGSNGTSGRRGRKRA